MTTDQPVKTFTKVTNLIKYSLYSNCNIHIAANSVFDENVVLQECWVNIYLNGNVTFNKKIKMNNAKVLVSSDYTLTVGNFEIVNYSILWLQANTVITGFYKDYGIRIPQHAMCKVYKNLTINSDFEVAIQAYRMGVFEVSRELMIPKISITGNYIYAIQSIQSLVYIDCDTITYNGTCSEGFVSATLSRCIIECNSFNIQTVNNFLVSVNNSHINLLIAKDYVNPPPKSTVKITNMCFHATRSSVLIIQSNMPSNIPLNNSSIPCITVNGSAPNNVCNIQNNSYLATSTNVRYDGNVTGCKYFIHAFSRIFTGTGGQNVFPGNADGVIGTTHSNVNNNSFNYHNSIYA